MQPSSVLMTADAVGGVWTYALDLAQALGRRDVRVALAVMGPSPSDAQRTEVAGLPNVTLHEHPGRLEWMDEPWADVDAAAAWLVALEQTIRPDVVHLNGYCHGALPWSAPVVMTGHSCVLSWWQAVRGESAPREWDGYAERVRRGLRAARIVVAPSTAMLDALRAHYGPFARACVIANGRSRTEFATTGKQPVVLTAGRLWDEAKNVDAVCRVASELAWSIRVAGDIAAPQQTGAGSSPMTHIAHNVTFLGRLDAPAMRAEMADASIYALPARYEPFGLSVLEAAQAGCALVLGDIPSLRETWAESAMYVDPDDTRMLAATLGRLIDDERLCAEMSRLARERAGLFPADRMGDRYHDLYAELMREVRPILTLGAV
jgi:glycogen synthase